MLILVAKRRPKVLCSLNVCISDFGAECPIRVVCSEGFLLASWLDNQVASHVMLAVSGLHVSLVVRPRARCCLSDLSFFKFGHPSTRKLYLNWLSNNCHDSSVIFWDSSFKVL